MANMDAESLKSLDKRFAAGLSRRNEEVLSEIDKTFSPFVRNLLKQNKGPKFTEEDIDEVMQLALIELWNSYRIETGVSVMWFFTELAKRKMIDRMRKNYRAQFNMNKLLQKVVESEFVNSEDGGTVLNAKEIENHNQALLGLVLELTNQLSDLQRTAFMNRFFEPEKDWAKKLELETGIEAKKWRKYSHMAVKNIEKLLAAKGIEFSKEGGRYEVA